LRVVEVVVSDFMLVAVAAAVVQVDCDQPLQILAVGVLLKLP
jgi:hypothetical protein